jgi:hypothetical protein
MSTIKLPTQADIEWIVSPVTSTNDQIGFAIGVASPQLDAPRLYFVGEVPNYLVESMKIGPDTCFELASNSKIFTTTLLAYYAQQNPDILSAAVTSCTPTGMAPLPDSFSGITLQNLANYTSGLPADNETATDWPQYLPQPYTSASVYGFLHDGNVPDGYDLHLLEPGGVPPRRRPSPGGRGDPALPRPALGEHPEAAGDDAHRAFRQRVRDPAPPGDLQWPGPGERMAGVARLPRRERDGQHGARHVDLAAVPHGDAHLQPERHPLPHADVLDV